MIAAQEAQKEGLDFRICVGWSTGYSTQIRKGEIPNECSDEEAVKLATHELPLVATVFWQPLGNVSSEDVAAELVKRWNEGRNGSV
jgi:hypothetical protein